MRWNLKKIIIAAVLVFSFELNAAEPFIVTVKSEATVVLKDASTSLSIYYDSNLDKGVLRAVSNLQSDFQKVTGDLPAFLTGFSDTKNPLIIIGTIGTNSVVDNLAKQNKISSNELLGKREKYLITNITTAEGVEAVLIAGSDKRGTIYGIYEFSRQIGVSPWYYWADVPVKKSENLYY